MTFVVIKKTLNQICAHYIICKHCDSIYINVEKKYIINMILLLQLRYIHYYITYITTIAFQNLPFTLTWRNCDRSLPVQMSDVNLNHDEASNKMNISVSWKIQHNITTPINVSSYM